MAPQGKLDFAKMSADDFRKEARRRAKIAKKLRDAYDRSKGVALMDKKAADEADAALVEFVSEETPPEEPDDS